MIYKVIRFFTDRLDNEYAYNVGDTYPHAGKSVSKERIEELASSKNKQGRPLIEAVEEPETDNSEEDDFSKYMNEPTETKYSKGDIMRMSTASLKALGAEIGIEDAENKTGGALKPLIIKKLGL